MKISSFLGFLTLIILFPCDILAQVKNPKIDFLSPYASYVSENGRENRGFAMGVKGTKTMYKRFSVDGGLTYFSTNIININQRNAGSFIGEEKYYGSLFITPSLGFRMVGKENSMFTAKLNFGPFY